MSQTAVMLCGHGSRDEAAVAEFTALAESLRHRVEWPMAHGFLEFARPIIRDGLDRLRDAGAREILAVPGMLFAAGHVKNDVPSVLNAWARETGVRVRYGRDLGHDTRMVKAAGDRVREASAAADAASGRIEASDTLLLVVGRGSSDPDANANVAKVSRLLTEGLGLGWGETAYSGVTFPLVAAALDHVVKLGFRRIVVFPYFLFTGVLVRRIYDAADRAAALHPDTDIVKAGYLNDHRLVVDTFVTRINEILEGTGNMNCQACKYREQVLGFEDEVGLKQESYHHHVEGIGTGSGHHHDHGHGHHHPYPHRDHPLGPASLKSG